MRRRAVVVRARAVHERLAVATGVRKRSPSAASKKRAAIVLGRGQRRAEAALAGAGAVQIERRLEQRGEVVEEGRDVRAAVVRRRAARRPVAVAHPRERRSRRRRRRRRACASSPSRLPARASPEIASAFHAATRLRSVAGAHALRAHGEQLRALAREARARLARARRRARVVPCSKLPRSVTP